MRPHDLSLASGPTPTLKAELSSSPAAAADTGGAGEPQQRHEEGDTKTTDNREKDEHPTEVAAVQGPSATGECAGRWRRVASLFRRRDAVRPQRDARTHAGHATPNSHMTVSLCVSVSSPVLPPLTHAAASSVGSPCSSSSPAPAASSVDFLSLLTPSQVAELQKLAMQQQAAQEYATTPAYETNDLPMHQQLMIHQLKSDTHTRRVTCAHSDWRLMDRGICVVSDA
jgi:hypothetical protein